MLGGDGRALHKGDDGPWTGLVRSGLDAVMACIEQGRQGKYARVGDRVLVVDIVERAFELLSSQTNVSLGRWSGKDFEEILTYKTNVTMWLDARFDVEPDEPYAAAGIHAEGDRIQLTVAVRFKLAGHVRKGPELGRWFREIVADQAFQVEGVGQLVPDAANWFTWSEPFVGTKDEVAERIAAVGAGLLTALQDSLAGRGLQLVRESEPS